MWCRSAPPGGYRWERIHYTTLFDDRRRPVWAVAIVEDVSDQSMPSAAACRRSSSGRCCRWMC
ncbi:MAG: hypothetical protein ACLSCQ_10425 [Evtepia gabavorous]